MSECVFCRILRRQESAEVLYRSERVVAILDINPIHFGHILVIPRTHAETFLDVPDAELPELIQAVQVVSRAMVEALRPPGFNIFSNNGKAAGQSVFHFHFHVTPRYEDDKIQFVLKLKKYSSDEMKHYADRIRLHLSQEIRIS
jgi:histidine triad (HIT) family protein